MYVTYSICKERTRLRELVIGYEPKIITENYGMLRITDYDYGFLFSRFFTDYGVITRNYE